VCARRARARARPLTSEIIRAAAPAERDSLFADCEIAPAYSTNEVTFHLYILLGKTPEFANLKFAGIHYELLNEKLSRFMTKPHYTVKLTIIMKCSELSWYIQFCSREQRCFDKIYKKRVNNSNTTNFFIRELNQVLFNALCD
jgi:hypothetical protein